MGRVPSNFSLRSLRGRGGEFGTQVAFTVVGPPVFGPDYAEMPSEGSFPGQRTLATPELDTAQVSRWCQNLKQTVSIWK